MHSVSDSLNALEMAVQREMDAVVQEETKRAADVAKKRIDDRMPEIVGRVAARIHLVPPKALPTGEIQISIFPREER